MSNSEQTSELIFATIGVGVSEERRLPYALLFVQKHPWRSEATVKVQLKTVVDALKHDGNQLEHHARNLRTLSPDLEAEAEAVEDRVQSIRKQIQILERWE